ncbi:MAG: hypothetical protein J6X88_04305 [Bacteroidales bacterium]|nr:hypothetical protein [Bacteroidales bacterium]
MKTIKDITDPKTMYWTLCIHYYILLVLASRTTQLILGKETTLALILQITLPLLIAPWLPLLDDRYKKLKKGKNN